MPRIGPSGSWETPSDSAMYWSDKQNTVGGVATFSPTSNEGMALFTHIYAVQFTAEFNTAIFTSVPMCSLKLVSADRKTVTANVVTGTVLGILGATKLAAPDGTPVHCLIMGD